MTLQKKHNIEVGYGYYELSPKELIFPKDEYYNFVTGRWETTHFDGYVVDECIENMYNIVHRRAYDISNDEKILKPGELTKSGDRYYDTPREKFSFIGNIIGGTSCVENMTVRHVSGTVVVRKEKHNIPVNDTLF